MRRYKGELPPSNRTSRESAPSQLSNLPILCRIQRLCGPPFATHVSVPSPWTRAKWLTAAIIGGQESTDVEVFILYCRMVETPLS